MIKTPFTVLILAASCLMAITEGSAIACDCSCAKTEACGGKSIIAEPKYKQSLETTPEKMKGVKTVISNTKKGVKITMTANDKEIIAKVQEMAPGYYNDKEIMEKSCPGRVEGAEIKVINTKTGVKVEVTGTNPEVIKAIHSASKEHKTAAYIGDQQKSSKEN